MIGRASAKKAMTSIAAFLAGDSMQIFDANF
jgi:hypothetical protein